MMKHLSQNAQSTLQPNEESVERLGGLIDDIGVTRFVGRIQSGLIDSAAGYVALSRFTAEQERRPLLSEVADVLFSRQVPPQR